MCFDVFCSVVEMRVMALLKELVGLETLVGSSIVKKIKKGCMKAVGDRATKKGNKERTVMTLGHVRLLISRFYKRPAKKVSPANRRFLLQ